MWRGTQILALLLAGASAASACSKTCYDDDVFQAGDYGVSVAGFAAVPCTVLFSAGGKSAEYDFPPSIAADAGEDAGAPDGGLPDAATQTTDQACSNFAPYASTQCTPAGDAPGPSSCNRSASCLQVILSSGQAVAMKQYLGGTAYHVSVACGGVRLYELDADAYRQVCTQ